MPLALQLVNQNHYMLRSRVPLHALITRHKFQFKQKNMTNVACFHGQHFLCSEGI